MFPLLRINECTMYRLLLPNWHFFFISHMFFTFGNTLDFRDGRAHGRGPRDAPHPCQRGYCGELGELRHCLRTWGHHYYLANFKSRNRHDRSIDLLASNRRPPRQGTWARQWIWSRICFSTCGQSPFGQTHRPRHCAIQGGVDQFTVQSGEGRTPLCDVLRNCTEEMRRTNFSLNWNFLTRKGREWTDRGAEVR